MPGFKANYVCFTWYGKEDVLVDVLQKQESVDWYVYGEEVGTITQHFHLQGMAYNKKKSSWKKLRALCHVEKTKAEAASDAYCKKDGKWTEWGVHPPFAKQLTLSSAREVLQYTEDQLLDLNPFQYL